jgi:DNA polymerase I-like protein with 3'-5' exonuclease and polymerase domains
VGKMISLDTETQGLDIYHGAKPFFVVMCEAGSDEPFYWEWEIDPLTREPHVPSEDIEEIKSLIASHDTLVLQNGKFDVAALRTLDPWFADWPWEKTEDTLIAGHLLSSNTPHDLTTMTETYVGRPIQQWEDDLEKAVVAARRACRSHYKDWAIAKEGRKDMPSAKGQKKLWKVDSWLPRALWQVGYEKADASWETVLREYAKVDAWATIHLWLEQIKEIRRRGLEHIYRTSLKRSRLAHIMENRGITVSKDRLDFLQEKYREESTIAGKMCEAIAAEYDPPFDLKMPKAGSNKVLDTFTDCLLKSHNVKCDTRQAAFDYGKGSSKVVDVQHTKTGRPSTAKAAVDYYRSMLPPHSKEKHFFDCLSDKRRRDTAIAYMDGYRRFWLPWKKVSTTPQGRTVREIDPLWFVLHPSLNPTGTDTLRWSSSNPNAQNISKQETFNLRLCFGPAPGREWWSLDAKNIELRIPAYESGQKDLIDLFESPDDPPFYGSTHLLNFSVVYHDLWEKELREVGLEKVGPHCKKKYASSWYQWCKNGGFAVQYGAVDRDDGGGTADRAFHRRGSHSLLRTRFSKLEALNQRWIRFAEEKGYVETLPDRSVDPDHGYPLLCSRTEYGRIKPTVPLNYHVQGTAMWWTMMAMIRCQDYLDTLNKPITPRLRTHLGYHMTIQCHDELVFDFPRGDGPEPWKTNLPKIRHIQGIMERCGADIGVPTPVGLEYHESSWAEGVTL